LVKTEVGLTMLVMEAIDIGNGRTGAFAQFGGGFCRGGDTRWAHPASTAQREGVLGSYSGLEMAPQSPEKIDSAPGNGELDAVAAPVLAPARGGRAGPRQAEASGLEMAP
jgi:hypothetical protein